MIGNIQRIRLYVLVVVLLVIIAGVVVNVSAGARLADINLLNQTRVFAYAAEMYKRDYLHYPVSAGIDLRSQVVLTENGFAPGNRVYYQGKLQSYRAVEYRSDEKAYLITFTLRRTWPDQGITDKHCVISPYYTLSCVKEE